MLLICSTAWAIVPAMLWFPLDDEKTGPRSLSVAPSILDSLVKSLFRSNQNKRTLAWVQYTVSVPYTTPTYGSAQMC